jgi:hypothetical protein
MGRPQILARAAEPHAWRPIHRRREWAGIVAAVPGQPRIRSLAVSAIAIVIAAVAVLAIARATGADEVGKAFSSVHPEWIEMIAAADILAYPAYMLAYRLVAHV